MAGRTDATNFNALYRRLRAKSHKEYNFNLLLRQFQPKFISLILLLIGFFWIYHAVTTDLVVVTSDDLIPALDTVTTKNQTEDEKKNPSITQITLITSNNVTFVLNVTHDIIKLLENRLSVNFSDVQGDQTNEDKANANNTNLPKKVKRWRRKSTQPMNFEPIKESLIIRRIAHPSNNNNDTSINIVHTAFNKTVGDIYMLPDF